MSDINITTNANVSNSTDTYSDMSYTTIFGYYSLCMVIFGSIFNVLIFIVLCRPAFRNTKVRPTIHYMRALALIDFIALYGWNLDRFLDYICGFTLNDSYTIASCKFFSFFNYVTTDVSVWLHAFICFDRYLYSSRLRANTWFNRSKSVLIIIGSIVIFFTLFNIHFFIFVCYVDSNGQINVDSKYYQVYPTYDQVNIFIYNIIPSTIMILLNTFSIYHLIQVRRTSMIQNSHVPHRSISIMLISTSFLFMITRSPSSIMYGFFYDSLSSTIGGRYVIQSFNLLLFTFPVLNFPVYVITFGEFRFELISLFMRNRAIFPRQ